jgi:hypothetical protein
VSDEAKSRDLGPTIIHFTDRLNRLAWPFWPAPSSCNNVTLISGRHLNFGRQIRIHNAENTSAQSKPDAPTPILFLHSKPM